MVRSISRLAISTLVAVTAPAQAWATLTPTVERGERIVLLDEPGEAQSICVIPRHLNKEMYSSRDLEKEVELCNMNRFSNVAVCPKTSSTNPGLEFYLRPQNMLATEVEMMNCKDTATINFKKVAKYKSSVSCSYTPSILAYYHISRILGGAGGVPPAVLRTFDIEQHKKMGEKALRLTRPGALIQETWKGFLSNMEAGAASRKKDALFTDDIDQTYGALVLNDGSSEFYSEMFNGGSNQPDRYTNFKAKNALFKSVANSSRISSMVGQEFNTVNVQKMEAMKDVADMIVLDTLLNQQDRLGNVDYVIRYIRQDKSDLSSRGNPRIKSERSDVNGGLAIKKMNLRDNDCGVAKENHSRTFSMIEAIAHINPLTYQRLLMLDKEADKAQVKDLFTRGMMFTEVDYSSFRRNLTHAAHIMKTKCRNGTLKLDLDAEAHFAGKASTASCDI